MATFLLIHGQWHDGASWDPVAGLLRTLGHTVLAPDLPFDAPAATYEDRARPALELAATAGDDLVVVGHSMASAEAAIVAARRSPSLLVYLCPRFGGFPVPDDAPPIFRDGFPFPPRDEQDRGVWDPDTAVTVMYPRLVPDVARALAASLRPGASPVGDYPLNEQPDVPTALVYTTDDEFFTPEWERFVAREMLGVEPIEIPGGHFPMAEDSRALAELLDRLA